MDQQVAGIHCAASGGHQAARAVAAGLDHGVGNRNCSALAVAENGVGVFAVRIDDHLGEIKGRAVCGKDRRVVAVEVGFVAAVAVARLDDLRVAVGGSIAVG